MNRVEGSVGWYSAVGRLIPFLRLVGLVQGSCTLSLRAVALCGLGWVLVLSVCHARVEQGHKWRASYASKRRRVLIRIAGLIIAVSLLGYLIGTRRI